MYLLVTPMLLPPSQALCILANVADGDSAKDYIMGNEDMLKKLMNYMVNRNLHLLLNSKNLR